MLNLDARKVVFIMGGMTTIFAGGFHGKDEENFALF